MQHPFYTSLGFAVAFIVMLFCTAVVALGAWNGLRKYNIGGVRNTLGSKAFIVFMMFFVVVYWWMLLTNLPFSLEFN